MLYRATLKVDTLVGLFLKHNNLEHYYPNSILFRTIVEHFLTALFVGIRNDIEKSDEAALDYYTGYLDSEIIKRTAYDLRLEGMLHNVEKNDSLENINRALDQAWSQSDRERIHKVEYRFDIKNIMKFLIHGIPESHEYADIMDSYPVLIKAYNITSSYVHGGPTAEFEQYEWFEASVQQTRLDKFGTFSKLMALQIKEMILFRLLEYSRREYYPACIPLEMFLREKYVSQSRKQ
ncbi:hypothetical protein [Flaviaesturariibacter amylovorans]